MRTLIFATCGLIVALAQTAHAAKTPIEIKGLTEDGHPCSISAIVGDDKKLEQLVVTSEQREIYSGNFMTVEKQDAVQRESTSFSQDELKAFDFVPDMKDGKLKGALVRADLPDGGPNPASSTVDDVGDAVDVRPNLKRIRIKIYEGDKKGFSFSQRSVGSKYSGETFLYCSSKN